MIDFGKSDKMMKISGKVDKSNAYNGFSSNTSFFIQSLFFKLKFLEFFNILVIGEVDKITVKI